MSWGGHTFPQSSLQSMPQMLDGDPLRSTVVALVNPLAPIMHASIYRRHEIRENALNSPCKASAHASGQARIRPNRTRNDARTRRYAVTVLTNQDFPPFFAVTIMSHRASILLLRHLIDLQGLIA
jgi:hypothetical protein